MAAAWADWIDPRQDRHDGVRRRRGPPRADLGRQYQHARGWPTGGFNQRSGSPNVWKGWIIYPVIAWASMTAASGWAVYGRQQIPAGEIGRETERGPGVPG